ncbi:MAG: hemin uptake protein HemP [Candidatus Thiodiazotropha sp. 6PLUC2]
MHDEPHQNWEKDQLKDEARSRIQSSELFRDQQRIEIVHRGEVYRLQITRQGKLILTK